MAIEIEHKYLVRKDLWAKVQSEKNTEIKQGYLLTDPNKTIRVRIAGDKGYLTIKGMTVTSSRPEYEYPIPYEDAKELLDKFCSNLVEKTRHYIDFGNHTWEVDVFKGNNEGLIIAEIELSEENEPYNKPNWVDLNVTTDRKYTNSNLAIKPFNTWGSR